MLLIVPAVLSTSPVLAQDNQTQTSQTTEKFPTGDSSHYSFHSTGFQTIDVHWAAMPNNQLSTLLATPTANTTAVQFSAMGRDFRLQLQASRFNDTAGELGIEQTQLPALYTGTVEGDNSSWVRLAVMDGEVSGYLSSYGKLLRIESAEFVRQYLQSNSIVGTTPSGVNANNANLADSRWAFALFEAPSAMAGVNIDRMTWAPDALNNIGAVKQPSFTNQFSNRLSDQITNQTIQADTFGDGIGTAVTRAMRIGIVVDSRFNEFHQKRGLARALSIINSVDAIYQQELGLAIIVAGISVYDDAASDPLRNAGGTVDDILQRFRPLRIADTNLPLDLALVHLFSGHRDPERVIGLGWISTACRVDGYDLSMSTPFPFDTLLAAHEIAHNLGALHDNEPSCAGLISDTRNELMWPELSGASQATFSRCSINDMQVSKLASCNLENIDVSTRLRTLPTNDALSRTVAIEVSNNDLYDRAAQAITLTQFPDGTQFSDLSAGCVVIGFDVECAHGIVPAQDTHSMVVTATLANSSQENVISHVYLDNAADTQQKDNFASIKLLQGSTPEEAIAADDSTQDDDAAVLPTSAISGVGAVSPPTLMVWFLMVWLYSRRINKHAYLRASAFSDSNFSDSNNEYDKGLSEYLR